MYSNYEIINTLLNESFTKSKCVVLGKEIPCSWNAESNKFVTPKIIRMVSMHVSKNWLAIINLAKKHYSGYLHKWFDEHSPSEDGMASFVKQLVPSRVFIVVNPRTGVYGGCHVSIHGNAMFNKLMGHELSAVISATGQLQDISLNG
jgi:hypothetical protein